MIRYPDPLGRTEDIEARLGVIYESSGFPQAGEGISLHNKKQTRSPHNRHSTEQTSQMYLTTHVGLWLVLASLRSVHDAPKPKRSRVRNYRVPY